MTYNIEWITTGTVASKLQVHRNTVLNWARKTIAGCPTHFRPGTVRRNLAGRYFFKREEIDRLKNLVPDYH